MTREQLQTAADIIATLLSEDPCGNDFTISCESVLNMFMYRWGITGKVIEQGEVYKAPNPQIAWYNSEGKQQ